jgi:hypothetical protein
MNKTNFTKGVERLVNPVEVGALQFLQGFNRLLPKSIQEKLVNSSAEKNPYMGFVVEPYCLFLCYEIADIEKAKELLPDDFELVKTRIFNDDEPKFYCIISTFRVHTSAFWGSRLEFYVIAQDKKTGLLSWVIIDYDTDTISYDKKHGLRSPNSKDAVVTTNYDGLLVIDIKNNDGIRELVLESDITKGKMKNLDERLWIEGNLSVGYGKFLSENQGGVFSLKFEPKEVEKALKIAPEDLNLQSNTWFPGLLKEKPAEIVCFPYSQHFVSDSPGHASNLKNKDELIAAAEGFDFEKLEVFSTKPIIRMFMINIIISFLITLILLLLVIFK